MQRFETLFDKARDIVLITEPEGRILQANPAALAAYDYTLEEILALTLTDLWRGEFPDSLSQQALAEGLPLETTHFRKDGRPFSVEVSSTLVELESRPLWLVFVRDLRKRWGADRPLASTTHYRLLFEAMTEGVCVREMVYDVAGEPVNYRTLDVNPGFERIMQIPREQAIGRLGDELYGTEEPAYLEQYARVVRTGRPDRFQSYFAPKGKHLDVSVFSHEPGQFVTVFRDVTETVLAQDEVRKSNQRNESLVKVFNHDGDDEDEILAYVLEEILKLSGSDLGFIVNKGDGCEPERWLWSRSAQVRQTENGVPLDGGAIDFLREVEERRCPVLLGVHDAIPPTPLTALAGEIRTFLLMPMNDQEDVLLTIGLANKETDYNAMDLWQVTILLESTLQFVQRKRSEQRLAEERELFRSTITALSEAVIATDVNGIVTIINDRAALLTGWQEEDAIGQPIQEVFRTVDENTRYPRSFPVERFADGGEQGTLPLEGCILQSRNGVEYFIAGGVTAARQQGRLRGIVIAFDDVTEEKNKQRAIAYLSYHDSLTGLYNRRFFEEELHRLDVERNLPLTIVMGDVNGLKLANDVFGHLAGDDLLRKAAEVLSSVCRRDDILARWGGDEFVLLLPRTSADEAARLTERLKNATKGHKVGLVDLSISIGSYTKQESVQPFNDAMSLAEDAMYRNKTLENQQENGKLAVVLLEELFRRVPWERQHAQRVSELAARTALELGLPVERSEELRKVGEVHDIGKIVISPKMLSKKGALTEENWKELRRHPEVGYHIIKANRELAWMADFLLCHHERMDGSGYPRHLKGTDIPLYSRVLAVADSYDAMRCGRYSSRQYTKEEALDELRALVGSRYDPEVVEAFSKAIHLPLEGQDG